MNFPFVATITNVNGRLIPKVRDREQFDTFIKQTFPENTKVWVTVKRPSKTRTHEQFKYLYSCVYGPIAEYTGMTLDETDGVMKKRHLTVNIDTPLEYVRNKTDLDRKELAEYIDSVRADAANMGIETQSPIGE